MKFKHFRLQGAEGSQTSTGGAATTPTPAAPATPAPAATTLLSEGDNTNTADTQNAEAPAADASKQPPTDKPEGKPEGEKDGEDAPPAKAAPEKYELAAPEGVKLDTELLGEFEGLARELDLTQEAAQKVTDIGAKLAQKWATQQAELIQTAAAEWATASRTDKEFGGDKLAENLAVGEKALDAFGSPELRTLLKESRFGNHPEVIRFMVRAGRAISEDRMVTGGAGPTGEQSLAQRMYPGMNP